MNGGPKNPSLFESDQSEGRKVIERMKVRVYLNGGLVFV